MTGIMKNASNLNRPLFLFLRDQGYGAGFKPAYVFDEPVPPRPAPSARRLRTGEPLEADLKPAPYLNPRQRKVEDRCFSDVEKHHQAQFSTQLAVAARRYLSNDQKEIFLLCAAHRALVQRRISGGEPTSAAYVIFLVGQCTTSRQYIDCFLV